MADTLGVTLSHADGERRRTGIAEPHPILVLGLPLLVLWIDRDPKPSLSSEELPDVPVTAK